VRCIISKYVDSHIYSVDTKIVKYDNCLHNLKFKITNTVNGKNILLLFKITRKIFRLALRPRCQLMTVTVFHSIGVSVSALVYSSLPSHTVALKQKILSTFQAN